MDRHSAMTVGHAPFLLLLLLLLLLTEPAGSLRRARRGPVQADGQESEVAATADDTAARDLACVLYDAAFLNCSWGPGPAAPPDVQYFLFVASSRERGRERECPRYVTTPRRRRTGPEVAPLHTGCHARDLSALGSVNYFRVNGSGGGGGRVGVLRARISARRMERFPAPGGLRASCNASHCRLAWSQPTTWLPRGFLDFRYQLRLRPRANSPEDAGPSQLVDLSSPRLLAYVFPSPADAREARVRAGDVRGPLWSPWSGPAHFGSDAVGPPVMAAALLAVLGTVAAALGLGCFYARVVRPSGLWGPVPRVRDKVRDGFEGGGHDGTQDLHHDDEDEADVLTVQEVTAGRGGAGPGDVRHPGRVETR